jgi:hypothetical protein
MSYFAKSMSLEPLEHRRLLSLTLDVVGEVGTTLVQVSDLVHITKRGTLVLKGTGEDDVISVSRQGNGIVMRRNGTGLSLGIDATRVKRVLVEADGGDDRVFIDPNINTRVTVVGGSGNDTIDGSMGDTLIGGSGDDRLQLLGSASPDFGVRTAGATTAVTTIQPFFTYSYNFVIGEPGFISGGTGNDTIVASSNDSVVGGLGNDRIFVRPPTLMAEQLADRAGTARTLLGDRASGIENFDLLVGQSFVTIRNNETLFDAA